MNTIGELFLNKVEKFPEMQAVGSVQKGAVNYLNNKEYLSQVEALSLGLRKMGMNRLDKVSILSQTRLEWHLLDLAITCSGSVTIPIYPTYLPEEIEYIVNHSEASILIAENKRQLKKIRGNYNNLKIIISIAPISETELAELNCPYQIVNYCDLKKIGVDESKKNPGAFVQLIEQNKPQDIATIIYTSGTTGDPKGAVITNESFVALLNNAGQAFSGIIGDKDTFLIFLPLAHVFGRVNSMMSLVFESRMVFAGALDKLISNMSLVRPTVVMAVPRIFEKVISTINTTVESGSSFKKAVFKWSLRVSNRYYGKKQGGAPVNILDILAVKLAYKLVFSSIYQKFGGRMRFFVSGGAPLSVEVMEFLKNANLMVLEGYGLTESIGPCTCNTLAKRIYGSVGTPMGDVKVDFSDEGEILLKSKALFSGYYKDPEATAETLKDGWLYTGDIGKITESGHLVITDRKKDIIITSGGKNVAPQKIESMGKNQKYISQMVIIGDKQKYLTAVVGIEKGTFVNDFKNLGIDGRTTIEDLARNERVYNLIRDDINRINKNLPNFEKIRKFYIAPDEFTVESGHLTSSLKVKKRKVLERYRNAVDAMY